MKSADKHTVKNITEAYDAMISAGDALQQAREDFNEAVSEPLRVLVMSTDTYNTRKDHYNELIDALIDEIEEYVEERSDRWREGETGTRYETWVSDLRHARREDEENPDDPSFDDVSIDLPEVMPDLTVEAF